MKKSLLALAVLGAFAGAASAQSSVTMYGRVDLSIGKSSGSTAKFLANGSGSRLGMRGVEDLGGGMKALFNIEHRFNADTGAATDPTRMWGGRSIVGLEGGFGQVVLGREYTPAFLQSQLIADPWGWDTVATNVTIPITRGGAIGNVRYDNSITYRIAAGGVSFGAQIAEADGFDKKPFSFAVNYAGGPLALGFASEGYDPLGAGGKANWNTFQASYNFGAFKLGGFIGNGKPGTAGTKHKSYLLTATAPLGAGEFRAAYGNLSRDQARVGLTPASKTDVVKGLALGYHYSLSKRTTIYADMANNNKALTSKTGYDVGIKHNF